MGKKKVLDLYRAPFPLYTIKVDSTTGLVITAGGGGPSKTGIKNAVHFLDVKMVGKNQYSSSLLHSHDTDTRATINMAVGDGVIAAGQDGTCSLMKFKLCQQKEENATHKDGNTPELSNARRRCGKAGKDNLENRSTDTRNETVQITVTNIAEVLSDLNPHDPLQKVVRFSPDMKLLLTGGTDGYIRVWEFPSLEKKFDFKAHEKEIEDLDISTISKHLVTVGRDFVCNVWSDNQLVTSLNWLETMPQIAEKTYRYMACRFGNGEDEKDAIRLYTVQIPHKRDKKPPPCFITKWDGKILLPMLTSPCGTEVISCLAVSDSGRFLGLGTVTGSVAVHIAFSLQKLYYVHESHGIVVTDVVFLPNLMKGQNIKGNNKAALLSVAVDSRCQVHTVTKERPIPPWLFFCGLIIVGVLLILQYLFPVLL
ncbi:prolactin regulatory element-binding protein [Gambusia affinis]|uniref:prolactin regulatory element-binding protein n=1 Tax=Gambusia affinis TaxID=33528 RepID=UPI001CDCEBE7|nr:prolactin regulatory element-binding protein [Gambusia affinis]XP_043972127.1 prolactin regulatory element-binding protein [Gambusia affinis]XP_043972128.1 prolactin regulatory element-binding protein [Gambusia affinis]XP_043972129.1 prolactin regulatory element-binding protein [Gambusia affinis]